MRVDMQVEVDDVGRMFIGYEGDWYFVYDSVISEFLGWIIQHESKE